MAQGFAGLGIVGTLGTNQVPYGTTPNPYALTSSANLTFNPSTNTLTVPNITASGTVLIPLLGQLASLIGPTAGINNAETIIVGGVTSTQIPANYLTVGVTIRVMLMGTCTSSAANVSTFRIRLGTAGTVVGDGVILSAATAVAATTGTNIPFTVTIMGTIKAVGAGTSGTIIGNFSLQNQSGAAVGTACTGIVVVPGQQVAMTATGFNTTAANYIEVTYQSAATTTTCTFQVATIEIL